MPVTIGTLTSRVNVSDGGGGLSEDLIERIVRAVTARVKQEMEYEHDQREEREVHDRASEPDRY